MYIICCYPVQCGGMFKNSDAVHKKIWLFIVLYNNNVDFFFFYFLILCTVCVEFLVYEWKNSCSHLNSHTSPFPFREDKPFKHIYW